VHCLLCVLCVLCGEILLAPSQLQARVFSQLAAPSGAWSFTSGKTLSSAESRSPCPRAMLLDAIVFSPSSAPLIEFLSTYPNRCSRSEAAKKSRIMALGAMALR